MGKSYKTPKLRVFTDEEVRQLGLEQLIKRGQQGCEQKIEEPAVQDHDSDEPPDEGSQGHGHAPFPLPLLV